MQIKRIYKYPLDLRGVLDSNLISGESYDINAAALPVVIAREGDFFGDTLRIKDGATGQNLVRDVDFAPTCFDIEATEAVGGRACYGAFQFLRPESAPSKLLVEYRLVGGEYVNRVAPLIDAAINVMADKRQAEWKNILNKPTEFPPKLHNHYLSEITDFGALIQAIRDNTQAILALMTNVEARLTALIYNLDRSNRAEHTSILALIEHLNNQVGDLNTTVANIKSKVENPEQTFNQFALKSTKINGHALYSDIHLEPEEIDAVSASRGGTFRNSFVDNLTNYGRMNSSQVHRIYNKSQIDDFKPGSMIPVWKDNSNDGILPMSPGLGQLTKLTTGDGNFRIAYTVLLYMVNGETWHGYAVNATTIRWTKFVMGEIKDPVPPGAVLPYVGIQPPKDYFIPQGQPFDKPSNPVLSWLLPSGRLPDMRGLFLRMYDMESGRDPDGRTRGLLTYQDHSSKHWWSTFMSFDRSYDQPADKGMAYISGRWNTNIKHGGNDSWGTFVTIDSARWGNTSSENRPMNMNVTYIMKAG